LALRTLVGSIPVGEEFIVGCAMNGHAI
jgi:hypothetical protein